MYLHADDAVLAQVIRDNLVVGQGDALLVDLGETSLVDELTHCLQRGLSVGDVGLDVGEHGHGGEVHLEEGGVVQLEQSEELQDLSGLGGHTHDTKRKRR